MNKITLVLALAVLLVIQAACRLLPISTPTPLPGWSDNVRELFINDSALPTGWKAELQSESAYPRANHVQRAYSNPPNTGLVSQDIWRAYTIADAEEKYAELRESQFQPRLAPEEMVAPWDPPEEINFRSNVADEYYLACGWEEWAYCQYLARYRNYVTYLRLDREAVLGTLDSEGLSFAQIEAVLEAVDARFNTYVEQLQDE